MYPKRKKTFFFYFSHVLVVAVIGFSFVDCPKVICANVVKAQKPCTGPCQTVRPDFKCRKKINAITVDTDTLLIRENANVCGDLTVNGSINNLEFELLIDTAVPPTDEVYNQFFLRPFSQVVLENIQEFIVPREIDIPGTQIYPNAPIYGYNDDQTLDLSGGPDKSYNEDFQEIQYRYHGQNPEQVVVTTPENMQVGYEHAMSYFIKRGFSVPGLDVYPQFEGQFIFNNNIETLGYFIGIKFYYEDNALFPNALDLVATAAPTFVAIDLFEPDLALRKNGRYYPVRIPLTTNIVEFNQKINKEAIVYLDTLHRRITIHIPDCSDDVYELSRFNLTIPCCECQLDIDYVDNLVGFNGTFNLMRRNAQNQLVLSSLADVEYLIQASPVVSVKSEYIDHGIPTDFVQDYLFSEPGGLFTGLAIPLMNGGSPSNDIYTYGPDIGAVTVEGDPLILPIFDNGFAFYQEGDNPTTKLIENLGSSVYNTYLDGDLWFYAILGLPFNVMNGQTTPEENSTVSLPTVLDAQEIFKQVVGHELVHNVSYEQGTTWLLPGEGQASSVQMDIRMNNSAYSGVLQNFWTQYIVATVRGDWPLTLSEIASINLLGTNTYGASIFWKYLASQFDYNYQVIRRMSDILSHDTINPLLKEQGIPFQDAVFISGTIGVNPAAALLALNQALNELHGKNVQDVFSDFAISLAMLRNNGSLPEEYRHAFPYWLNSPLYPGYQDLSVLLPEWATWWQDYQDNILMPEGYSLPQYDGQRFVPILDHDIMEYPMKDMTMLMFEVPDDVGSVTIDVIGDWRISAVQFTSTGTVNTEGIFLIDGPNVSVDDQTVIDMSQFTGTGPVRLICAHVSMPLYQGLTSICGEGDYTGSISITRDMF